MAQTKKPDADRRTRRRLPLSRVKAVVALAVVGLLSWGSVEAWRRAAPIIRQRDEYVLSAEKIAVCDPPVWIVGDVRERLIQDAGFAGRLSILDERFTEKIRDALLLNPWIESVDRIEKQFPAGAKIDVTYRKPVAVVELPDANGRRLAPVDRRAIHLPEHDVPENRRHWLPRIVGIVGEPPLGQAWGDPRVAGAVDLAVHLSDYWDALYLSEIVPSARPRNRQGVRYFEYELVTRGGTRIVWGAAPNQDSPGEASFATKLQRLQQGVEETGPLNTVRGPKSVNVRDGLKITYESARKSPLPSEPETSMH